MTDRADERDAAFRIIEEAYESIKLSLESTDQPEYKSTKSGMWAVSKPVELYHAFCHFQLARYEHLADLGSGDGRVALIGSLFTRTTGYETDEELYKKSLEMRDRLRIKNARFIQEDYLLVDLSPYNVLYLYPDKPFYALEERLRTVWQGYLLVNGPHFPPRHFRKIAECPPSVGRFVLYESA